MVIFHGYVKKPDGNIYSRNSNIYAEHMYVQQLAFFACNKKT
jgi:hypothetical protein